MNTKEKLVELFIQFDELLTNPDNDKYRSTCIRDGIHHQKEFFNGLMEGRSGEVYYLGDGGYSRVAVTPKGNGVTLTLTYNSIEPTVSRWDNEMAKKTRRASVESHGNFVEGV